MSNEEIRILVLCTGNSCRSQMAEGYLRHYLPGAYVASAGTKPAERVHPDAILAMSEKGFDISAHAPKMVDEFLDKPFSHVITVCDSAKETCPVFSGQVKEKLHIGFDDPAEATGSREEVLAVFRRVRDEIAERMGVFAEKAKVGRAE